MERVRPWTILVALAGLAILAYLPVFVQPFIADDYVQIHLARRFGPSSGWAALAADPLYRCRATSLLLTYWTERVLGFTPLSFYGTSVLIHILNTWLVFALGAWRFIGWRVAAVAAAFFAVHEGHQGGVMWYASLPELLVFLFVLLCLALWALWLRSTAGGWRLYAVALFCFLLALASKESAVVTVPLLVALAVAERASWRRLMLAVTPMTVFALGYAWAIVRSRATHLHFNDGTFSLDAPVWVTWSNSYGRLLWIWGAFALLALAIWRARQWRALLAGAMVWIGIALLPYCFLLYMPRVPSRHTYLASVGLALIVAAAFLTLCERWLASRRWVPALVAVLILTHNVGYLWVRKRAQYLERAAPTEKLIEMARHADGPIYIHCFPYPFEIAERAVEMVAHKPRSILLFGRHPDDADRAAAFYCAGHAQSSPAGDTIAK